eukprot:COSAG02_NODE_35509_length_467_cov_0.750000_1_plen_35_part_10
MYSGEMRFGVLTLQEWELRSLLQLRFCRVGRDRLL